MLSEDATIPWERGTRTVQLSDDSGRTTDMTVCLPTYRPGTRLGAVVCLHGAGSRGDELCAYFHGVAQAANVAVICPTAGVAPDKTSNLELAGLLGRRFRHARWIPTYGDFPMQALRWARSTLGVDPDRCAIIGHSMGAIATWALAMRFTHAFSAALPIAGAASMWEMFGPDRETDALLPNLRKLPLFVVHGAADTQIPIEMCRGLMSRLQAMGHRDFAYVEIPDGEHPLATMQMTAGVPHYDRMVSWLFRRHRQRWPMHVEHQAVDESHGRAHWIELRAIERGPTASVVGRILTGELIQIEVSGARQLRLHLHHELVKPGDITVAVNGKRIPIRFSPTLHDIVRSFIGNVDPGLVAEQVIALDLGTESGQWRVD
ncbi:alpha/beta fold hydrolase [Burkholderia sp. Bp9142]|uniref:carboxylesterase family protein n=1 Tax=Burkholderia sp. Bp9142 TaxID=2184573 RepID=UPI001626E71F|nr:alpha/beta fold hydrolase [Burkholderia sp. Bp9142]